MNYSVFWARVLGFYAVIVSIGCFLHISKMHKLLVDLAGSPSAMMVVGMFTLFLGLAIVVSHSVWRGWPILITVLGYWIAAKGIVLLFFSQWVNHILAFWQGRDLTYAPVPALVIGLILLFCGYFLKEKQ